MTNKQITLLRKLNDSEMVLADTGDDVRGHAVIDRDGNEVGEVSALMLDDAESRVRVLQVKAGGFLGIGERTFLVPVDAVTKVDAKHVHVDQTRDRVVGSPAYDPDLAYEQDYYTDVYGYYGYAPFWGPGYLYPGFPYYR